VHLAALHASSPPSCCCQPGSSRACRRLPPPDLPWRRLRAASGGSESLCRLRCAARLLSNEVLRSVCCTTPWHARPLPKPAAPGPLAGSKVRIAAAQQPPSTRRDANQGRNCAGYPAGRVRSAAGRRFGRYTGRYTPSQTSPAAPGRPRCTARAELLVAAARQPAARDPFALRPPQPHQEHSTRETQQRKRAASTRLGTMLQHPQFRWQRVARSCAPVAMRALRTSSSAGGSAPAAAAAPQQAASKAGDGADPGADWHVRLLQAGSKARDRPKKKKAPRFPEWSSDNFLDEGDEFNDGDAGAGGPRGARRRRLGARDLPPPTSAPRCRRAGAPGRAARPRRPPAACRTCRPPWLPPGSCSCLTRPVGAAAAPPCAGGYMTTEKRVPAEVRCFDTARINVKSGDGGAGCVAFRCAAAAGAAGRAGCVWLAVQAGWAGFSGCAGCAGWILARWRCCGGG
jgi:hypothetical protein